MNQLFSFIFILSFFQSALGAGHIKTAYADFNGKGVQGRITFTDDGAFVLIETSFPSFPGSYPYHVHIWPVDYTLDPASRCGPEYVGGHYDPFGKKGEHGANYGIECANNKSECEVGDLSSKFGPLAIGEWMGIDNFGLSLSGSRSILFRSIVLHLPNGSRYTCATIIPGVPSDMLTARARFNGPTIGGSIYFLQEDKTAKDVTIFVDLFLTNSGMDLTDYGWKVYPYPTGTDGRRGDCGRIGGQPLTTLTDRHGTLAFRNTGSTNKLLFTEYDGIRLTGGSRIIGGSISIESSSGGVVACATIRDTRYIQASVEFREYRIEALQYSRFLPTHIRHVGYSDTIANQLLHTEGYFGGRDCDGSLETYSPFSRFVPTVGFNNTQDINVTGELGSWLATSWVWHHALPLSGFYSTKGRTVSIRRDGVWECGEWQDDFSKREDDSYIYRARAMFSEATCFVWFYQRVSSTRYEPNSDPHPSIPDFDTGEVTLFDYCPWGSATRQYTILNRTTLSGDSSRFNPYWVPRESDNMTEYTADCTNNRAERCEVGDLTRLVLENTRWTGIHTNLEMLGEFGVSYHIVEMTDSSNASLRETGYISPIYATPFTVCVSDCNEATIIGNELMNPHELASIRCASNISNVCEADEFEVSGIATGANSAAAEINADSFTKIYSGADYQVQGTLVFILLSLVLLSLLSY